MTTPSPTLEAPVVFPRGTVGVPFFAAESLRGMSLAWMLEPNSPVRIVVAKATCDIDPTTGALSLREEGDPIGGDEHHGDPLTSSLRQASDIAIVKARGDVTLWGHAHGGDRPSVDVRFAFGDAKQPGRGFDRRLRAFGKRGWKGKQPGPAEPFEQLPLAWELAAHDEQRNPVGVVPGGGLAHQLEPIDEQGPAGFGAIAMMWPLRLALFGSYDESWYAERFPFFFADFDPAAYQAAPRSQQLERIAGDESFVLEGLHPEHRRIEGQLPNLHARVYAIAASPDGGIFNQVPLRLDSVFFDLEQLTVSLVWRGSCEVSDRHASNVAAWFGQLHDGEQPPSDQEIKQQFWSLYQPDGLSSTTPDAIGSAGDADAPPVAGAAMDLHERKARERLQAAGMSADLLATMYPTSPAALVAKPAVAGGAAIGADKADDKADDDEDTPPAAPAPRVWLAPQADPKRAEVVAWLAGGDAPDPASLAGAELSDLDFSRQDMRGFNLRGSHLAGCRFEATDLTEAELGEAVATKAVFDGARLDRADLTGMRLDEASFAEASLSEADLTVCAGDDSNFTGAKADGAQFVEASFERAVFDQANLEGAAFSESMLCDASFKGAQMRDVRLYDADASRANFEKANLAEARGDGIKLVHAICDGACADEAVMDGADLSQSSWLEASMRQISLVGASGHQAKLMATNMRECRLAEAQLIAADLRGSDLMESDFSSCNLSDCDLRGANLYGSELFEATLTDAKLEDAIVGNTIIEGA